MVLKKTVFLLFLLSASSAFALTLDQACRTPLYGATNGAPQKLFTTTLYGLTADNYAPSSIFYNYGTSQFSTFNGTSTPVPVDPIAIGYIDRLPGAVKASLQHLRRDDPAQGLYNDFYTIDPEHVTISQGFGSTLIGSEGYVSSLHGSGLLPIYRLYNPAKHDHAYTTDSNHMNQLINWEGYNFERIEGYLWSSPNKIPVTDGLSDKFFCFGDATRENDVPERLLTVQNTSRFAKISTQRATNTDRQTYELTLNTKDYFVQRGNSDHIALFTWGSLQVDPATDIIVPGSPRYGRGLVIGSTSIGDVSCQGVVVEYLNGSSAELIAGTCRPISFTGNQTFNITMEATSFDFRYRLWSASMDTGWVTASAPPENAISPSGDTEIFVSATNDDSAQSNTGPAHLEILNNVVTIESLLPPPPPPPPPPCSKNDRYCHPQGPVEGK